MASAMRKMAVYLGLVEDDHRYQESTTGTASTRSMRSRPAEEPDEADPRAEPGDEVRCGYQSPTGARARRRPISRVSRHCILAPTMKRVLLVSTSAMALR